MAILDLKIMKEVSDFANEGYYSPRFIRHTHKADLVKAVEVLTNALRWYQLNNDTPEVADQAVKIVWGEL